MRSISVFLDMNFCAGKNSCVGLPLPPASIINVEHLDLDCNVTHKILPALIRHTSLSTSRNTCLGFLGYVCSVQGCISILVALARPTQICWLQERSTYSLFYALLRFLQKRTVIPYDFLYCIFLYRFLVFGSSP
jgi:hypothetical protein